MRLLLDTHTLLWFIEGSSELSQPARHALENDSHERMVSYASAWEIAIKTGLGKLKLPLPYEDLFPEALQVNGFMFLGPDFQHYQKLIHLSQHHRDPFDRLLAAQALCEGLTLVTRDPHFSAYGVQVLW